MDNVLVDFNSSKRIPKNEKHIVHHPAIYEKGFFRELLPMPGAINFVQRIIKFDNFDIYIATQPVAKNSESYKEKVEWISEHFPVLLDKIVMTQNKLLLKGDFLIDDNAKWRDFDGEFILFDPNHSILEFEDVERALARKNSTKK